MIKRTVARYGARRVVIMDSISYIDDADRDQIVVSGSHGGAAAARYALAEPPYLTVFNDAGIGKDDAGIAALPMLAAAGHAAVAVAHTSARIGDGADTWRNGVIAHVNQPACRMGLAVAVPLRVALQTLHDKRESETAMDVFINPLDHAQGRDEKPFKHTFFQSDRLLTGLNCLQPGQEQPIHDHADQDKFYFVLAGEGLFTVGDGQQACGPGKLILAPAGVPHGVRNDGESLLSFLTVIAPFPHR